MLPAVPIERPDYRALTRAIRLVVASLILLIIGFSVWKSVTEYRLTVRAADVQTRGYARALKEHAERAFSETDSVLLDILDRIRRKEWMKVKEMIRNMTGVEMKVEPR